MEQKPPIEPPPVAVDGVSLAIFDIDHTLVEGSTGLLFARYLARRGHVARRKLIRAGWWVLGHRLGFVDAERMIRDGVAGFTGMSQSFIDHCTDRAFRELIEPRIVPRVRALLDRYRERGIATLLLSGSSDAIAARLATALGADGHIGIRLEMDAADVATGRGIPPFPYGAGKLDCLHQYLDPRGIDLARCAAFTDSASDLPLLEAVGFPHAVNPDRRLRREATRRGWPVI